MKRLKLFISRDQMWGDTFAVRMAMFQGDGPYAIAQPVQFKVPEREDIEVEVAPSFTMSKEDGQAFIDQLWSAGFRPTEGSGSAGSLAATQAHLHDMRAIVGKQLGVEFK